MQLTREQHIAYSFFKQHPLVTLSTISTDGVPQHAAMYVYFDDHMQGYFATRDTTRKFANLKHNPTVVLSVHDENVLMFGEITGTATILESTDEVANILPELQKIVESRKSSYWVPPVAQLEGEGYVFFKLAPSEVTFVNYELSSSDHPKPMKVVFSPQN